MKDFSEKIKEFAQEHKKELGFRINSKMEPITDGIFDNDTYKKQKIKILWILKEPYDEDEKGHKGHGGWSITDAIMEVIKNNEAGIIDREFINKKQGRPTYHPMIRASYRILHPEYKGKVDIDRVCGETIRSIAYINSSKMPATTGDRKSTDMAKLQKYAQVWTPIITEQIEEYSPDIIIFGNTFQLYTTLFNHEKLTCWSRCRNVKLNFYYDQNRQRLYVDAYHPSYSDFNHKYEKIIWERVNKWLGQIKKR